MSTSGKKKDPEFAAAVLKLSFIQRSQEQSPHFVEIYRGVLRDLKLSEEQVDRYLEANYAKVEEALEAGLRESSGPGNPRTAKSKEGEAADGAAESDEDP